MLEDATKSIKSTLYDRISSPLFGAFAFSWCLWNYKLIMIVLSSLKVKEKIEYIENTLYVGVLDTSLLGGLYPLLTSLAFIFIYPVPAKYIYQHWYIQQKKLKEIKQGIEDETPLTIDESRTIRREILNLENEFETQLSRKDSDNDQLKEVIRTLEKQLNNLEKSTQQSIPSPK